MKNGLAQLMSEPVAVIISDIHFTPGTLELATKCLVMAINKAKELGVPLIVAGDTLDTKGLMRAECVNRLISIFDHTGNPDTLVIVGNHDLINEKGSSHTLNFLKPYVEVIEETTYSPGLNTYLLPYHSDLESLKRNLLEIPFGSQIIMHQGVQTAFMGHYVQDKTSLSPHLFADYRVISGHYHRAQDIKCGRPRKGAVGLFSYIGNPYSLTFGEANDGPKGFRVLNDDGLMDFIPTNLRKHVILEVEYEDIEQLKNNFSLAKEDLLWLKIKGPKYLLSKINKKSLLKDLDVANFKLDLIPNDEVKIKESKNLTDSEMFDALIDAQDEPVEQKMYLKTLWRDIILE